VIRSLVEVAETDENIGFVSGKVYYYDQPDTLQTVGKHPDPICWNGRHIGGRMKDEGQFEEVAERVFMDDIYILVRRSVYEAVGGFDTSFRFQAEEFDWQARAKRAGFKLFYTPQAIIWHKESMTIGKRSAFKAFYDARNPMLVILKHRSPEYFRRYFWHHFRKGVVRTSLVYLKNFRPMVSLKIWQGFFSGIWWGLRNGKFSTAHFVKVGRDVAAPSFK
jgi:GT2 family glycosyltransferase